MILSGSAVQEKGFGLSVSATKRLMAAWSSTTHQKTPRFSGCLASLAKKPSTALSHEHKVGVQWKATRVLVEPLAHLRMLMGGVVVEDHVHELRGGHLCLDSMHS